MTDIGCVHIGDNYEYDTGSVHRITKIEHLKHEMHLVCLSVMRSTTYCGHAIMNNLAFRSTDPVPVKSTSSVALKWHKNEACFS